MFRFFVSPKVRQIFILICIGTLPGTLMAYPPSFLEWEKRVLEKSPRLVSQKHMALASQAGFFSRFPIPGLMAETMVTGDGFETSLSQSLPFPGKMAARILTNRAVWLATGEMRREMIFKTRSEFRDAYLELFRIKKKEEFLSAHRDSLRQHESRLSGSILRGMERRERLQEVRIENVMLEEEVLQLAAEKESAFATFETFFDIAPVREQVWDSLTGIRFRKCVFENKNRNESIVNLVRSSARWKAQEFLLRQKEGALANSWLSFLPDFSFSASYKSTSGLQVNNSSPLSPVDLRISMEIPWSVFTFAGDVSEMGYMVRSARSDLVTVEKELSAQIKSALAGYEADVRRLELLQNRLKPLVQLGLADSQNQSLSEGSTDFIENFHRLIRLNEDMLVTRISLEKRINLLESLISKTAENLARDPGSLLQSLGNESNGVEHVH